MAGRWLRAAKGEERGCPAGQGQGAGREVKAAEAEQAVAEEALVALHRAIPNLVNTAVPAGATWCRPSRRRGNPRPSLDAPNSTTASTITPTGLYSSMPGVLDVHREASQLPHGLDAGASVADAVADRRTGLRRAPPRSGRCKYDIGTSNCRA